MMWPPVLDMTREECRGVLRRLELETYANVISTFRAQGGLNDTKSKLLEELRNVFHISTDRHRAEARRVANDEQLCTIAETISGPNTTQEWSREGRRSFPLLSRSAPYTALSAVANGVSEVVKNENVKLPYPSETTRTTKAKGTEAAQDVKQIVKQDPSLLSADEKRNLKRQANSIIDIAAPSSPTTKKRTISSSGDNAQQTQPQLQTHTKIQQLYHNHSKTQSRHKKGGMPKRSLSANMKNTVKAPTVVNQTSVKVNSATKTPKPSDSPTMPVNKNNLPIPRNLHTYASMPQPSVHYDTFSGTEKSGKLIVEPAEAKAANNWPQIATSKKDITNNLSKLNMMTNSQMHASPGPIIGESGKLETIIPPSGFTSEGRPLANNVVATNPMTWASKTQSTISTTIVPRPAKSSNANVSGSKSNINNNNNNKQMTQTQHQPSPNSSAISLPSGLINISQKAIKPENASIVTLNERKEIELANAGVVAATTFVRQDSISVAESGGNNKAVPFVGSGNFDLKTNTEGNTATIVGSTISGAKPKIQIHSNQTINPGYGSLKLSPGVPLKCLTSGRKTVQLYSSPSGKMFIQSAEGSKSQLGATSGSATTSNTPNRYALQKVQIVTSSSANPVKPVSFNKSEMILMPGSVLSTAPNSGNVVVRSFPVMKQSKRLPAQILSKPALNELSSSNSALVKNQNVIVIGAVQTEKNVKDAGSKAITEASSMITEDTPVDILTTPLSSLDSSIQVTAPTISKDGAPKYDLKSPITVLQTIASPSSDDANKRIFMQEEPSARLSGSHKLQQQAVKTAGITTSAAERRDEVNTDNSYIVSSTDWELELDQQASSKSRHSRTVIIQDSSQEQIQSDDVSSAIVNADSDEGKEDNEASQQIIDNFHDVIEEDAIYEDSMMNDTTEGEDDVEFDVSYGSVQEEMEDGVAIEYVEDAGNSSDVMIEEYGEMVRSDTDDNDRGHTVKMLPVSQAQTIIYSTSNRDIGARGKIVQSSESSSSSSVIFEIDENGLNQMNR